jgi:hypothetical protein
MTLPTPPLPGIGSTTGDDAAARGVRARVDDLFGHPVVGVPLRTGLLMAAAFVMEVLLLRITRLPDTAYARPVLVDGLLGRIAGAGAAGLLVGAAFVGAVGVAILKRSPGPGWTDFEHGPRVRLLVTLQAAILAWVYALQDYNFFFDQGWPVDRLLVVAAVALVAFRPAFILPFLVLLLPLVCQLTWPIGGFSWAVPILPVRVLILCAAMWILRMVTSRVRTVDWIFVVCRTIAIHPIEAFVLEVRFVAHGRQLRGEYRFPGESDWRLAGITDLPLNGPPKVSLQCYQGPADAEHWARLWDFRVETTATK